METKQIEGTVYLSLKVNGILYQASVYEAYTNILAKNNDRVMGALCIVNQFLADKKDTKRWIERWHGVHFTETTPYVYPFLLTKKEFDDLNDYAVGFCGDYKNLIVKELLPDMRRVGFFTQMDTVQANKLIKLQRVESYKELLENVNELCWAAVHGVMDDKDGIILTDSSFILFVTELAKFSHGEFQPEKIFDKSAEAKKQNLSSYKFGFEVEGMKFEKNFIVSNRNNLAFTEVGRGLIALIPDENEKIIEMINEYLRKSNRSVRVYKIKKAHYVFLTPAQYQFLKEKEPALFQE